MKSVTLICAVALLSACSGNLDVRNGPQALSPSGGATNALAVSSAVAPTEVVITDVTAMQGPTETLITERVGPTGMSETLGVAARPSSVVGTTIISGPGQQQTGFATISRP